MSDHFESKMLIMRHLRNPSNGSLFEFTLDTEDLTLDDVVVDSLRSEFENEKNGTKYFMESKDGNQVLLKLMKGLKLYGWTVTTSHSFCKSVGREETIESIFYYEKRLSTVANLSSVAPRQQISALTKASTAGVEESKSTSLYTSKPLPSAASKPAMVEEGGDTSQRRVSANVSSNRDKLLQKYNQHRRASAKGLDASDGAAEPARMSVSQLTKSFSAPVPNNNNNAPGSGYGAVSSSSGSRVASATIPTVAATAGAAPEAAPSAVAASPASDLPKVNAASAFPSLVKRISSKGFMPVSNSSASSGGGAVDSASKSSAAGQPSTTVSSTMPVNGIAQHSVVESSAPKAPPAVPAVPVQMSSRPPPVPPPMPAAHVASSVPAPASVPVHVPPPKPAVPPAAPTVETAAVPAPVPAPPVAPAVPVASPPAAPPAVQPEGPPPSVHVETARTASVGGGGAEVPLALTIQSEPSEPMEEMTFRSSANPLSSPFPLQKRATSGSAGSFGTPDNDPHEANRTNHYSKLGSAFLTGNALGGRGGRGGGRGFTSSQSMFIK